MPPALLWPLNLVHEDYRDEPPIVIPTSQNSGGPDLRIWTTAIIGEGSVATVFAGMLGDRRIAVKLFPFTLTTKQQQALDIEAGVWEMLKHPRVLRYVGVRGVGICQAALLSPYMENGNMLQFIKKYPAEDHLKLLQQVADGVHYLHTEASIVHGDLKGTNVLISESRTALLTDFGHSTFVWKTEEFQPTATYVRYYRTVQYAAPEIFTDSAFAPSASDPYKLIKRSKTTHTDVYAFGMLIYEVITGDSPWAGVHPDQIPAKVTAGERPVRPEGCTEDLWQLCQACWAQDSFGRPSIHDVLITLTHMVSAAQ